MNREGNPQKPEKRTDQARAKTWLERGLFFLALAVLTLGLVYLTDPSLRSLVRPHNCLLNRTTGLLCPACGATRAYIHLLGGRFCLALKSNALAILSLPLVFYGLLASFRLAFDRRFSPAQISIAPALLWAFLAVAIAFLVARNIPCFSFLRP